MNVLASICVLGFLVFFHETGHFLAARLQGIRVSGFSIGFGPAIIKKEVNGITYSLRALPLGGFVSFPDDENNPELDKSDPDLLKNRSIRERSIVISAGVIANLLIAWLVLIGHATFSGLPNDPEAGVTVMSVQPNEAAYLSGLSTGDRIISINGENLSTGQKAVQLLVKKIKDSPGKEVKLITIKDDAKNTILITPSNYLGDGRIGAQLQANLVGTLRPAKGLPEIVSYTNSQFIDLLNRTVKGYASLVTNFSSTAQQLSGPVKIVEIGAQLSEQGGSGLVMFTALISINLAVLNSLPLPLLDGGQLAFLLIESIRGRPIPEKIQLIFMQSGFLLLVGLSVVLIIRDTVQLEMIQNLISRY